MDSNSAWRLAAGLYLIFQGAPVAADVSQGVLAVSLTVQASCVASLYDNHAAVPGTPSLTHVAHVSCPIAYPYQASISSGVSTGQSSATHGEKPAFTGAQRLELAQFPPTEPIVSSTAEPSVMMLTIFY